MWKKCLTLFKKLAHDMNVKFSKLAGTHKWKNSILRITY